MKNRYNRNMKTISAEENQRLKELMVCVVGCGGLGGYIIEMLGRLGIGEMTVIDGDVFDETNLNRQILSTEKNIGKSKAIAAKERMAEVNGEVKVTAHEAFLKEENSKALIAGHHMVFDALDNMGSRRILERSCEEEGIPMIHGAIAGWFGQLTVIFPGDRIFEKIYPEGLNKGEEVGWGNPAYTPAVIAAMEVAEGVKVLLDRENTLRGKLLTIDLLTHEYEVMEL
ncbi:MAG: HesA/MoeB/ThiF family protein [Anaerovoracaceae bacterium]